MIAPLCFFPEEMFLRAAIILISLIALIVIPPSLYIIHRLYNWHLTKNIRRLVEKEKALHEMTAVRFWHETR